ncbi:MAG TPA: RNA polymerase sigma factor [Ignavibacteria bacterium]|nr:RNA polymerase sigma factor [Ignavibacteria bacterium]HMR41860.1 RNA polymerase sigma factor [Ignavibacteria bacterium]
MPGQTDNFLELLKPCYSDALKYCKALCAKRSLDDAEDVLQLSLIKGMENIESLTEHSKFRSWFFKIITREFYSFTRKDFWRKFLPIDSGDLAADIPELFDRGKQSDDKLMLEKALAELSTKERSALLLFELGGFSIEEIKEIQNEKSVSAVKSRLSRARSKLKQYIVTEKSADNNNSNINSEQKGDLNHETITLITEIKSN